MINHRRILYVVYWSMFLNGVISKFDSKTVNLQVETSLQFDPTVGKNHSIKEIKNFISRLQDLLIPIKELLYPNKNKMSEALENLAVKLSEHNDREFAKISKALVNEVDDRVSNNKYLSAILGNKYKKAIKYIQDNPTLIRVETRKSTNSKHFKTLKELATKLDKYYNEDEVNKLKDIANKLEQVPKRNEYLRKLVKETLNVLVFDKYKKLNSTAKSQLFSELISMQQNLKIKLNNEDNETKVLSGENVSKEDDSRNGFKENSRENVRQRQKMLDEDAESIEDENESIKDSRNVPLSSNGTDIIFNKNIEILIENDDLKSE